MSVQRRALSASVWCALSAIAVGCGTEPAGRVGDQADWGTGIVRHEGPSPAVVEGPRESTPQALAAGHWDGPRLPEARLPQPVG